MAGYPTDSNGVAAKIEDVLRQLPQFRAVDLTPIVKKYVDAAALSRTPNAFLDAGRAKCEEELRRLTRIMDEGVRVLDELHDPVHLALAREGGFTFPLRGLMERMAGAARKADVSTIEESPKGQTRDLRGHGLSDLLAYDYWLGTENRPTVATRATDHKAYGAFFDFVEAMLRALGADFSPEVVARRGAKNFRDHDNQDTSESIDKITSQGKRDLKNWYKYMSPSERMRYFEAEYKKAEGLPPDQRNALRSTLLRLKRLLSSKDQEPLESH